MRKKTDYTGIRGGLSEAIKLHFSKQYGEQKISKERKSKFKEIVT